MSIPTNKDRVAVLENSERCSGCKVMKSMSVKLSEFDVIGVKSDFNNHIILQLPEFKDVEIESFRAIVKDHQRRELDPWFIRYVFEPEKKMVSANIDVEFLPHKMSGFRIVLLVKLKRERKIELAHFYNLYFE